MSACVPEPKSFRNFFMNTIVISVLGTYSEELLLAIIT